MNAPIRILLVDDHTLVCKSIAEMLDREADICVVGTLNSADDVLAIAQRCTPDVILMDIDMPGLCPFDAAERIMAGATEIRIAFLSAHAHDRYVERVLQMKASGYILKSDEPEHLVRAVRTIAQGLPYYSPPIRNRIVVDADGARIQPKAQSRTAGLSRRELEVLRYVARGMSEKQIAKTMSLSPATVHNHCTRLMNKLDLHNRVELTRFALREGIVEV